MGSRRIVITPFQNISLGIDQCECFGILGPNGSGKSSLLNTTSFTFPQTLGKIYYNGKDTTERNGNEITLGYCPQEDTLWNEFTLFEHIEMFLYLRGYTKKEAKKITNEFINYCHLTEHKNKMPYELSGGTRRKLNILIALCCSSSKIIMDEPSAGMDPSTRRYVWDIIKATLQNNKSSTIMSTHSMEEAELLCNRIAIMVKGRLRCIGTPEHLKIKYGNTYILDVHTKDINVFHEEIVIGKQLFGNSEYEREDKSLQRVKYEVKNTNSISKVFEIMESCKEEGLFYDYSYSQTSLEQVFLNFALKGTQY
ncbi:P-loop containing nucleoside triphosphate hydrolase protein [Piromyces finnis]|uniref:p-loop containing nucleoside triphosphate hydrolase protein n=1 Tax=Piromyces finnis TaxID=1754191 RepID=A0A1Y1UPU9_9FUNG|nr:P-loop containing nucleoside triphosphate hydrolase protein [Piromyces finnis]|eukprot:ORX39534.1 P-loop containing nucleoside triphosphate hydrolase protein [Piromyces finnis]